MVCGDGVVTGSETCDDGNTDGDGCSSTCTIE
jgi:cysteine-rich repeat protein